MEIKNQDQLKNAADIISRFEKFTYVLPDGDGKKLDYQLFIPEEAKKPEEMAKRGRKTWPVVLFMHDAGNCSDDPAVTLTQGDGALIWADEPEQERHPCFVVAPCYPRKTAEDDFTVTWEAEATIDLLKELCEKYPIDTDRIYGTGQSMGCMMLCEMNIRHPRFFAASFLVAGQWDPKRMRGLKDENLWVLVSEKDPKAYPIMGECIKEMEVNGALVSRGSFDAKASAEEQNASARALAGSGNHIFFTWFEGKSVLPDGEEFEPWKPHVYTWRYAYKIQAVRDWMFAQAKPRIDFSVKHNILIRDEEGNVQPMDVPYFRSVKVASGTWQILSDGDYSYLVEGKDEALVIDSGYGCGNIRAYCQSLTDRPVRRIANTHDHFDHTANNYYFDCALMSEQTRELATIPFQSFKGIDFPRDYAVEILKEGDVISLGERGLEVFFIPDHAVGSLAFLDPKEGILFAGDELGMPIGKPLNGTVYRFKEYLEKLQTRRKDFNKICFGGGITDAGLVDRLLSNMNYILDGHEGERPEHNFPDAHKNGREMNGQIIYDRRMPRPEDLPAHAHAAPPGTRRVMEYAGCRVIYDIDKVR